jgi:hypothetical protein
MSGQDLNVPNKVLSYSTGASASAKGAACNGGAKVHGVSIEHQIGDEYGLCYALLGSFRSEFRLITNYSGPLFKISSLFLQVYLDSGCCYTRTSGVSRRIRR